jgi:hypothetical protein
MNAVLRLDRDRAIAALLLGAAALLLVEIRFEHREVLGETWRSWIPLAWSVGTIGFGLLSIAWWHRWGRRALAVCFALAVAVGAAGFWFHTDGRPLRAAHDVISVWSVPPGQNGGLKLGSSPPALAPLAFCGLGLLGLVICAPWHTSGKERLL